MKRLFGFWVIFFLGLVYFFSPSVSWAQPYVPCSDSSSCPSSHTKCEYDASVGLSLCKNAAGDRYVTGGNNSPTSTSWTSECTSDGDIANLQGFGCIFRNLLNLVIPLLGIALFVLVVVGGFQYMTAGGDPKQAEKARQTITSAIIGLVVVVGVWFVFQILSTITGLDLLDFAIPG
jgi:hypothetical protein